MALADLARQLGVPPTFSEALWPDFEAASLQLISDACARLLADVRRTPEWQELHYSYALLTHLRRICREVDSPLAPHYDDLAITDEEFAAGKSPKSAPKIDLVIRWHNAEPYVYFALEAKVLVEGAVGNYTSSKTVAGYVDEGVRRFVDGKYAAVHRSGSMVGYVLKGAPAALVGNINQRIAATHVCCSQHLTICASPPAWPHYYDSVHPRGGIGPIRLFHFFVTF